MMMTNELTSVTAKRDNAVRELGGKQNCLINMVLLLQNGTTELADKLARVAGRASWGLNGTRVTLADLKREQDGLVAIVVD
jgi:hypothetical protein